MTSQYSVTTSDGLVSGTAYAFRVISTNVVGDSPPSVALENVIAATPPSAPQNLKRATAVTPEDTKITLDWDAPSNDGGSPIVGYTIYWNQGVLA